jgi:predicted transcriptional regulator
VRRPADSFAVRLAHMLNVGMTKDQINAVLERVRTWSEERQAYAAEILLTIEAQDRGSLRVSDDAWAAIQEGSAQAERGEFVSDEEMAAFWKRHG